MYTLKHELIDTNAYKLQAPLSERVMLMGIVVIQRYFLVSKLKKTKTKFLRCSGYLNSIKPLQSKIYAFSNSYTTTKLSKLLIPLQLLKHVIKYCKKIYERSGKNLFGI